jgi:hypothetical protein
MPINIDVMAYLHVSSISSLPYKKLRYKWLFSSIPEYTYFPKYLNILDQECFLSRIHLCLVNCMIRQEWEQWQSFESDRREGGYASEVA